jgi:hypothetical protein
MIAMVSKVRLQKATRLNGNPAEKNEFIQKSNLNKVANVEYLLNNFPLNLDPNLSLNHIVEEITNIYNESAKAVFTKSYSHVKTIRNTCRSKINNKPWYGPHCHNKRAINNRARKKYNLKKSNNNRCLLNRASKDYKHTMKFYV